MTKTVLDRYKFRELERRVEKQRHFARAAYKECEQFWDEYDYYEMLYLMEKRVDTPTAASKDYSYIKKAALFLEMKRVTGEDVSQGIRCIFPKEKIPLDAFSFGDRSL